MSGSGSGSGSGGTSGRRRVGAVRLMGAAGRERIPETGDVIDVWWGGDSRFYTARVLSYDSDSGEHAVHYSDDNMKESIDLDVESWRFHGELTMRGRKRGAGRPSARNGGASAATDGNPEGVHPDVRRWIVSAGDEAHNIFTSCRAYLAEQEEATPLGRDFPKPGLIGGGIAHAIQVKQAVAKFIVSEKYHLSPEETAPLVKEIRARVAALGIALARRTPLLKKEARLILQQAKEITTRLEEDPACKISLSPSASPKRTHPDTASKVPDANGNRSSRVARRPRRIRSPLPSEESPNEEQSLEPSPAKPRSNGTRRRPRPSRKLRSQSPPIEPRANKTGNRARSSRKVTSVSPPPRKHPPVNKTSGRVRVTNRKFRSPSPPKEPQARKSGARARASRKAQSLSPPKEQTANKPAASSPAAQSLTSLTGNHQAEGTASGSKPSMTIDASSQSPSQSQPQAPSTLTPSHAQVENAFRPPSPSPSSSSLPSSPPFPAQAQVANACRPPSPGTSERNKGVTDGLETTPNDSFVTRRTNDAGANVAAAGTSAGIEDTFAAPIPALIALVAKKTDDGSSGRRNSNVNGGVVAAASDMMDAFTAPTLALPTHLAKKRDNGSDGRQNANANDGVVAGTSSMADAFAAPPALAPGGENQDDGSDRRKNLRPSGVPSAKDGIEASSPLRGLTPSSTLPRVSSRGKKTSNRSVGKKASKTVSGSGKKMTKRMVENDVGTSWPVSPRVVKIAPSLAHDEVAIPRRARSSPPPPTTATTGGNAQQDAMVTPSLNGAMTGPMDDGFRIPRKKKQSSAAPAEYGRRRGVDSVSPGNERKRRWEQWGWVGAKRQRAPVPPPPPPTLPELSDAVVRTPYLPPLPPPLPQPCSSNMPSTTAHASTSPSRALPRPPNCGTEPKRPMPSDVLRSNLYGHSW